MKPRFLRLLALLSSITITTADEPIRIVVECEEMKGIAQNQFGPGKGWQVGRWGHDLFENMTFGGVWASRLRHAMTDEGDNAAEVVAEIDVPSDGTYKVWAKYECPPFFNYAFGLKIESLDGKGAPVFDKTYGLREAAKHFCFTDKLTKGDLYWAWGMDHDAAEGYETKLSKGKHRLTLSKIKNVEPKGARSVDAILITSDLSELSAPKFPRYPLLDELRRANRVYFRFRNPKNAPAPVRIQWSHWNHRYNDFYSPQYTEFVKFYDAKGQLLEPPKIKDGQWHDPVAPGDATPWMDLGPTMNTESTSPFDIRARAEAAKPADPSAPVSVDIALEPSEGKILKSFDLGKGETSLAILVQPDLHRKEGVEHTRKIGDICREVTAALNQEPRLGPLPKKVRLFGGTGAVSWPPAAGDLPTLMEFREAMGLNTIPGNTDPKQAPAMVAWAKEHGGIVERSLSYHHTTEPDVVTKWVKEGGAEKQFYYVSYGDEIGLPAVDVKDEAKVKAFREFVKKHGETPVSLGLATEDQIKPLAAFSADVAVQIGVLPKEKQGDAGSLAGLKRLYWYSLKFRTEQGIASFAEKTKQIRAALGNEAHTTANLGGMHPFYWMHQSSFIESFKHGAMSLAWSEDYTYCMPQASRLVVDFETAYLRKGASYHDTPMQFYCMPHWPGNTPEYLLQCAVMEWGQNVKDLDFFAVAPDTWATENYVAYRGGLPTWKAIRTISGMAGLVEDHLVPARTEPAKIAMLLSESSDVWELNGKGQWDVVPGSEETNVSQEERMAIWFALRNAGYRVDHVTEDDCSEGLLKNYAVLYVCGQNLERKAAKAIKAWVEAGGSLFATAGAARKDEFDEPLTELDATLGRGKQRKYQRHRGPLRARLELLFERPLDQIKLTTGEFVNVLCSREEFEAGNNATVLGRYKDGQPAFVEKSYNKSRAYYVSALPGQAYVQPAIPFTPCGKGGTQTSPWMIEGIDYDTTAAGLILYPVKLARLEPDVLPSMRGVVTNRLKSGKSTVITVINLGQQKNGRLKDVEFQISNLKSPRRAWSCFHPKGVPMRKNGGQVQVTLPSLAAADVIVIE